MVHFDAHTHSLVSDGTDTPRDVMIRAAAAGLDVVALTDHDTFEGWEPAAAQAPLSGVALVRGVEFSTSYRGSSAHLLAYLPDPDSEELQQTLASIRGAREDRLRRMVANIAADYPRITWERLTGDQPSHEIPWGRPHLADMLVAEGYLPDRGAAFESVLSPRGPYFEHQWAPNPVDAVALVRRAGGVPVLAHPRSGGRQRPLPDDVVADMVAAGLFGLERDHREHDAAARAQIDELAARLGLQITGGSDYHGTGKPNQLGENLTASRVLEQIIEQGTTEVIGL